LSFLTTKVPLAPLGCNSLSDFSCYLWSWQFEEHRLGILYNDFQFGFVWCFLRLKFIDILDEGHRGKVPFSWHCPGHTITRMLACLGEDMSMKFSHNEVCFFFFSLLYYSMEESYYKQYTPEELWDVSRLFGVEVTTIIC
jgi:hypothetical protein